MIDRSEPIQLAREARFAIGDADVDPPLRTITHQGASIVVEPRVMQVIVALARANGAVIARDDLLALCWGVSAVSEDAIQRAVAKARRVGAQTAAFSIETVARVGYVLRAGLREDAPPARAVEDVAPPLLAVLPFIDRSQPGETSTFADGLVEDLISALAQGVDLQVLSRVVTAQFLGPVDPRDLGRRLGVRYLLMGSIRRSGEAVRVNVQLVEVEMGTVLWSSSFESALVDMAGLEEGLVRGIAAVLQVKVRSLEVRRALRKPDDLTAWDAVNRAISRFPYLDPTVLMQAVADCEYAIARAPDYALAHAVWACVIALMYEFSGRDDEDVVARIRARAATALTLESEDASVLAHCGSALISIGALHEATPLLYRATAKSPGDGRAHFVLGMALVRLDRCEDALPTLARAALLSPESPLMFPILLWQVNGLIRLGRVQESEAIIDAALDLNAGFIVGWSAKANVAWRLGKRDQALRALAQSRKLGLDRDRVRAFHRRFFTNNPAAIQDNHRIFDEMFDAADKAAGSGDL